jgi:NADP-dependent 3-hydroxy acid dehydrogenase YdfG
MKIAITGGTAGIGQALGDVFEQNGHEVLRLSRRNGNNIRSIPKIAALIEPCDMFINNAQAGFAQTELLFEMANRWSGTWKTILNVSSMLTTYPTCIMPGLHEYYIQKCTLEMAVKELRAMKCQLKLSIVRPGNIATSPDKTVPPSADVTKWAETLYNIYDTTKHDFVIPDISLGPV